MQLHEVERQAVGQFLDFGHGSIDEHAGLQHGIGNRVDDRLGAVGREVADAFRIKVQPDAVRPGGDRRRRVFSTRHAADFDVKQEITLRAKGLAAGGLATEEIRMRKEGQSFRGAKVLRGQTEKRQTYFRIPLPLCSFAPSIYPCSIRGYVPEKLQVFRRLLDTTLGVKIFETVGALVLAVQRIDAVV